MSDTSERTNETRAHLPSIHTITNGPPSPPWAVCEKNSIKFGSCESTDEYEMVETANDGFLLSTHYNATGVNTDRPVHMRSEQTSESIP